jgi:hypothetical protein
MQERRGAATEGTLASVSVSGDRKYVWRFRHSFSCAHYFLCSQVTRRVYVSNKGRPASRVKKWRCFIRYKKGDYFLPNCLMCWTEGMVSMVSLSRKQKNSPAMMMIWRSRIDIWEGKEAYIMQADSPRASFAKMMMLCKLRLWSLLLRGRIHWILASAQHVSIKLGRISISRYNASEVHIRNMNLGCIWFLHWFQHGCLSVVATMLTAPDSDIVYQNAKVKL